MNKDGEATEKSPGLDAILQEASGAYEAGDRAGAEALFRRAVELAPDNGPALNNLGALLRLRGAYAEALPWLARAIAAAPGNALFHNNLGLTMEALGRFREAEEAYVAALNIFPAFPDGHNNLANALRKQGRLAEAENGYRLALEFRPTFAEALNNLADLLREKGAFDESLKYFNRAVAANPGIADVHANRGRALLEAGRLDEALAACAEALRLAPDSVVAHNNRGKVLFERGEIEAALAAFDQTLARAPEDIQAHMNRAYALLALGRYREGWAEHDWRLRYPGNQMRLARFTTPMWRGDSLAGKRLLVHAEQGLGDALLAARFLPGLAGQAAALLVECPQPLTRLFAAMPGVDQVVTPEQPVPPHDRHLPMMSLPRWMGLGSPAEIPGAAGYLTAPPHADFPPLAAQGGPGQSASGQRRAGPAVGLAWRGNPAQSNDRNRSIGLAAFAPLIANHPEVDFVALQVGRELDERETVPWGGRIRAAAIQDVADAAGVIAGLDLVITVDSLAANLAGALGRPAWVLLCRVPDWRYGALAEEADDQAALSGARCGWYDSLRLFRQQRPGEWGPVIEAVNQALGQWPGPRGNIPAGDA